MFFPLTLWEETEKYKSLSRISGAKRKKLLREWREKFDFVPYVGPVEPRMSLECKPIVWVNSTGPYPYPPRQKWTVNEALKYAMKYGATGWYTLDDIELLLAGEGPMLKIAMQGFGYRPHKGNTAQWAKIRPNESVRTAVQEDDQWPPVTGKANITRLKKRFLIGEEIGTDLWKIQANKQGMIYFCLEPRTALQHENLGYFPFMGSVRAHVDSLQEGYRVVARNIMLEGVKGVHVRALRPDLSFFDCVWPHLTTWESLTKLAESLRSGVANLPRRAA